MLTFKFELSAKYINWSVTWDGRHDEDWYEDYGLHPFRNMHEYQDQSLRHQKWLKSWTEQGCPTEAILMNPAQDSVEFGVSGSKEKLSMKLDRLTKAEIDLEDPELMREHSCICARNPVTVSICEMLSHKENIATWSGNTEAYCYYCSLLGVLSDLWD